MTDGGVVWCGVVGVVGVVVRVVYHKGQYIIHSSRGSVAQCISTFVLFISKANETPVNRKLISIDIGEHLEF